jgi:MYXO-CTERM domain-containing protein
LRLEYRVPGAGVALQSAAVSAAAASLGGLALIVLGGFLVVGRRRST